MATTKKMTETQSRLLAAIRDGASLRYAGWQEIKVTFGPADPRNYTARQQTPYALRDRGLVRLDAQGVHTDRSSKCPDCGPLPPMHVKPEGYCLTCGRQWEGETDH